MKYAVLISFCLPALCAQVGASDVREGDERTFSAAPSPAPVLPVNSAQEKEWAAARAAHCAASDGNTGPATPASDAEPPLPTGKDLQEIGKDLERAGRYAGKAIEHAARDVVKVAKSDPGIQKAREDLFQARDAAVGAFRGLFRR